MDLLLPVTGGGVGWKEEGGAYSLPVCTRDCIGLMHLFSNWIVGMYAQVCKHIKKPGLQMLKAGELRGIEIVL